MSKAKKSARDPIDAVCCVWHWTGAERNPWELVRVATCSGGRIGGDRADSWPWLQVSEAVAGGERREVPGRLVTGWDWESGAFLVKFVPPEWSAWVAPLSGWDAVEKGREWWRLIAGGYAVRAATGAEARKVFGVT